MPSVGIPVRARSLPTGSWTESVDPISRAHRGAPPAGANATEPRYMLPTKSTLPERRVAPDTSSDRPEPGAALPPPDAGPIPRAPYSSVAPALPILKTHPDPDSDPTRSPS